MIDTTILSVTLYVPRTCIIMCSAFEDFHIILCRSRLCVPTNKDCQEDHCDWHNIICIDNIRHRATNLIIMVINNNY